MSFYVFAWVASILYGFYAITAKLVGKYSLKNTSQFSFFITLFSGIVGGIISVANGAVIPTNWFFIILAGLFLSLGNILYLSALKNLDVSVMSPLFNLRVVITVILGYLFLNERLTPGTAMLVGLVVVAGIFATMDEHFSIRSFFTWKVGLGLLFMLVLSIQSVFINRAIAEAGYWTASLWMGIVAIFFSFIFLVKSFYHDVIRSKFKDYFGVLMLSFFGGIGDLAAYKALEGNVGISSVIISLPISMVLAFILSVWKPSLLEKHTIKVYILRFTMAGIMIFGALKLSS